MDCSAEDCDCDLIFPKAVLSKLLAKSVVPFQLGIFAPVSRPFWLHSATEHGPMAYNVDLNLILSLCPEALLAAQQQKLCSQLVILSGWHCSWNHAGSENNLVILGESWSTDFSLKNRILWLSLKEQYFGLVLNLGHWGSSHSCHSWIALRC